MSSTDGDNRYHDCFRPTSGLSDFRGCHHLRTSPSGNDPGLAASGRQELKQLLRRCCIGKETPEPVHLPRRLVFLLQFDTEARFEFRFTMRSPCTSRFWKKRNPPLGLAYESDQPRLLMQIAELSHRPQSLVHDNSGWRPSWSGHRRSRRAAYVLAIFRIALHGIKGLLRATTMIVSDALRPPPKGRSRCRPARVDLLCKSSWRAARSAHIDDNLAFRNSVCDTAWRKDRFPCGVSGTMTMTRRILRQPPCPICQTCRLRQ